MQIRQLTQPEVKELPIKPDPPVLLYLHHALVLSMLLPREKGINWLYENFIQVFGSKESTMDNFLYEFYPNHFEYTETDIFSIISLNEKIMELKSADLIEKIIQWLNNSYYVQLHICESEVPGTYLHFEQYPMIHQIFIYAYDLRKKIVKILNFDESMRFTSIDVGFDVLIKAFESKKTKTCLKNALWNKNNKAREYDIRLYKLKDTYFTEENGVDTDQMKSRLSDYLLAKSSLVKDTYIHRYYGRCVWGLDTYREIHKHLEVKRGKELDHRAFQGLWEHKKLMVKRIEYLYSNGKIQKYSKNYKEAVFLEEAANKVRLLSIKYNLTRSVGVLDKIKKLLDSVEQKDKKLMEQLLNDIK